MHKHQKVLVTLAVAGAVVAGSSAAYAYWSTTGTGTGTAGAAAATTAVTAVQTSVINTLAPGVAAQTLSGNFTNTNPGPVYVQSVAVAIASVTKSGGTTCSASDFTITNSPMTVAAEIPAGTAQGSWTGAKIAFNDNPAVNQDACKGVTVNLTYTVS